MKNVGESVKRNKQFQKKFTRDKVLKRLITSKRPIIFDIGAHIGQSVKYLKSIFPDSQIYSFEPDPESFKKLISSVGSQSKCYCLAMTHYDENAIFFRNNISHTNSLLKVNLKSVDSIGLSEAHKSGNNDYLSNFNNEISIRTNRLDTFIESEKIKMIDLLKIDVQGSEKDVLNGAEKALDRTKVIVIEISFYDYYETQTSFKDIEQLIHPHGFSLYSISEISQNPMNGRTDWVEAIYIRSYK